LALLSGLLFRLSPWSIVILPRLVEFSVPFLVFGMFWLGTYWRGWPPLTVAKRRPLPRRLAVAAIGGVLVAVLLLLGTLAVSAEQSFADENDCGERPWFTRPLSSDHAAFTARAIRVGHVTQISGRWAGDWAIGLVQERFWGLPWWNPRLVLLTNQTFWEGETYLIDGKRDRRLLSRLLPIVEAGPCTRTAPVAHSLELRLLRKPPSPNEVRIVGFVDDHIHPREAPPVPLPPKRDAYRMTKDEIYALVERRNYSLVNYHWYEVYLPGARVRVTGSSGSVIVTSDRDGLFEVAGMCPDDYKLELLDVPPTQNANDCRISKKEMLESRLVPAHLSLQWAGEIEGSIRGFSGGPADVLLRPARTPETIPYESYMSSRRERGAFSFDLLPPGSYILRINPDGPHEGSPFAPQYYPASTSPEGAHVFEVGEGQQIRNVDFVLPRLYERRLRVRVAWPNGRPVDEAILHIAYEHADFYDRGHGFEEVVDHNGIADATVFSGSHIRMWAEQPDYVGRGSPSARYSAGIELETDKLPPVLELVVTSTKPPYR
jgi:hypothetical protein